MIIKAKQSTSWITPRKLRLVADTVRGKDLAETNLILSSLNKRGAQVINETIRQAVANAVNNLGLPEDTLVLKTLMINEGPKFRRFRAGARGQAKPYVLRTSHVVVELESPETEVKTESKAEPATKPEAKSATKAESTKKNLYLNQTLRQKLTLKLNQKLKQLLKQKTQNHLQPLNRPVKKRQRNNLWDKKYIQPASVSATPLTGNPPGTPIPRPIHNGCLRIS